jgi:hypothetical protein
VAKANHLTSTLREVSIALRASAKAIGFPAETPKTLSFTTKNPNRKLLVSHPVLRTDTD